MDKISCEVRNEIYNNGDFHIYVGTLKNSFEELTIKTDGFTLCKGEKVLSGQMGTYKGQKSFICKFEEFNTNSKEAQKNLLMSIKGIKESKADLIVNNVDDINVFRNDSHPQIKGVGPGTILLIREGLQQLDKMQTFKEINMMIGAECSAKTIKDVTETIEMINDGMNEFKTNPYNVLIDMSDFGFKKADRIALSMGIKLNDKNRLKYLSEYIVKQYTRTGNCFITKNDLIDRLNEAGITENHFELIENNGRLVCEDDCIYTESMFKAETLIPLHLKRINNRQVDETRLEKYDINSLITDFEKINKIKFDISQKVAIEGAVNNTVVIIPGSAGTGKTTLLKCVLFILKELGFKLFLTAPTGKAARRMNQSTGHEATTIHRFLNDAANHFTARNGVMIIDEMSMVDTELMFALLEKMDECSVDFVKIISVGDIGQLPSVQPGNVLNDMIESKKLNVFPLTKTFRQKGDSNILDIATKVRHNENFDYVKKADFYVKEALTPKEYLESIEYFFNYLKNKYDSIDTFFSEVQFISPIKKGQVGVISINEMIKNLINPKKNKNDWFPFDVNDKVMCTKNDRDNGIFNGEFGRVTIIDKTTFTVFYKDLEKFVTYKKEKEIIDEFILSYCSTVHKLQGSEFKYIVLIIPTDSPICDSRLLYTAITRGKQTVVMLTNKALTNKIVPRNNLLKRNTKLKERLICEFDSE